MTRVVDTSREPIASIALAHGFAESASSSFLEMAFHHALNGFEVVMVDMKGHGYTSGTRCCAWNVYDWHE
jgi:alpha-beta hydrolase superfamily lysophospholipase